MGKEARNLKPWIPSPAQVYAARLLAHMKTWKETASEVGVNIATISRWKLIPEFEALIAERVAEIEHDMNQELMVGALDILREWRKMSVGDANANEKRFDHNAPIVTRFYDRAIGWADAPPDLPARIPGVAAQFIINNGGQQSGRIDPPTDVTPEA
jgi:hypothetical protein